MAVQGNFDWVTWSRARVLRELAAFRTQREIAARLGMTHDGVRSIVREIKYHTGMRDVRDIGRWWVAESPNWANWALEQGLPGQMTVQTASAGGTWRA